MRKRVFTMLLAASVLATSITYIPDGNVVCAEEVATQEVNVEDFEYSEEYFNNDAVILTKYLGTATDLVIPEQIDGKTVVRLGSPNPFYGNANVKSIHIPSTVQKIEGLNDFTGLESITVAEDSKYFTVENGILYSKEKGILICCPAQKSGEVTIPESVVRIGDYAFAHCNKLTDIHMPSSIGCFGINTFLHCSGLKSIELPSKLTDVGLGTFSGCTQLETFRIAEDNEKYSTVDGILYNKEKTTVLNVPNGKSGIVTVPEGVSTIYYNAFSGCKKVTTVIIPESVTTINMRAFAGSGITSIKIPNSVRNIDTQLFDGCKELNSVTLPDSLESMHNGVFVDCSKLTSVNIPTGVKIIDQGTFQNCSSLTKVRIPLSVTAVLERAFNSCTALADVFYEGSEEDWKKVDINDLNNECLVNAKIHYNSSVDDFEKHDSQDTTVQPTDGNTQTQPTTGNNTQPSQSTNNTVKTETTQTTTQVTQSSSPEVQVTPNTQSGQEEEYNPEYINAKWLKWGKSYKVVSSDLDYGYVSYKIKVDKLSDVTIKFKGNKNINSDSTIWFRSTKTAGLYSEFLGTGLLVDKTDECATNIINLDSDSIYRGKETVITYKSVPAGVYFIDIGLWGNKKVGGVLTLSKKNAKVGQVNGVKLKQSSKKYTLSWNKAEKAKKYKYYCGIGAGGRTKIKTVKGTSCTIRKSDLPKTLRKGCYVFISAVNGKHQSPWTRVGVGNCYKQ